MAPSLDEAIFRTLYGDKATGLVGAVMITLTVVGSGWSMLALVPLIARSRTRHVARTLLFALLTTTTLVFALKAIVRRPRPLNFLPGIHAAWGAPPTDFSFPSGHAAGSFTVAFFVLVASGLSLGRARKGGVLTRRQLRRKAFIAYVASIFTLVSAIGIALSRIYLGVHYPGDTAAGAALGAVVGSVFAAQAMRKKSVHPPADAAPPRATPPPDTGLGKDAIAHGRETSPSVTKSSVR